MIFFSETGRYVAFVGALNEYLAMACRDLLAQVKLPPVRDFIVGSMGVSFSGLVLDAERDARVTFGCLPHLTREIPRLCEKYAIDPTRVTGMHAHSGDPTADRWGDEAFDLIFLTKKLNLVPEERIGEKFAARDRTLSSSPDPSRRSRGAKRNSLSALIIARGLQQRDHPKSKEF